MHLSLLSGVVFAGLDYLPRENLYSDGGKLGAKIQRGLTPPYKKTLAV
jgi:hypothetical protein